MRRREEFSQLVNLAEERVGSQIVDVSDEFFAEAENMLKPGRGVFIEGKYTDHGKWMDGWESRRKRTPGHDWCVIKLGMRGVIHGVDIDTNHFLGNHPPKASIEAADVVGGKPTEDDWVVVLPTVDLTAGSQNLFGIDQDQAWTHLRLNIYPDGGVARFKVYGEVIPDWEQFAENELVDLASVKNGGRSVVCNDMFFSSKDNLIVPGRGVNMGDGWETKRRREPGHDWVILKLGRSAVISKVEVDTCHFKGNFPDTCSLEGLISAELSPEALTTASGWQELLPQVKLQADHQHYYSEDELILDTPVDYVRLNIFPDGGISRLRLYGVLD